MTFDHHHAMFLGNDKLEGTRPSQELSSPRQVTHLPMWELLLPLAKNGLRTVSPLKNNIIKKETGKAG